MVTGGEVVGFIGEVALFPILAEANEFLGRLKQALDKQRDPNPNARTWLAHVIAHLLTQKDIQRYAQEVKSSPPPYPGFAVFLNDHAVHACQEFGLKYARSNAPNKTLPSWATPAIDKRYYSRVPRAGNDPK